MSTTTKASGAPESILQSAGVINPFADLVAQAKGQAEAYAKGEKAVYLVVDSAAKALGTEPTYAQWEAYREAWIAASPLDAPDKAWERFADLLSSRCGLTKPKAKGKAEKVAKARSEEAEKVEALAQEPREVLAQKAKALMESGTVEALRESQVIHKAIAAKVKADTKEAKAAFLDLRKEVREAVVALEWNALNMVTLKRIKEVISKA